MQKQTKAKTESTELEVNGSNWDSVLPAAVRYDSRLKGDAKVLYSEILLLSNKAGYCYATDQHLAALFDAGQRTAARHIAQLKKYGYIRIETKRQGVTVTQRRIYPLTLPKSSICQNSKSIISGDSEKGNAKNGNTLIGAAKTGKRGIAKTGKTGIAKIGRVNDSNSNDSKKELEYEPEGQAAAGIQYHGLIWYESLGSLDGKTKLLLDKYVTSLPDNVVQYAIDKAAKKENLKSVYGYLRKVLADYQDNGINTIDKLEALNDKRYKQLGLGQLKESDKAAKTSLDQKEIAENRKHGLPDWLSKESRESDIKEQQAKSEKDDIKERSKVHKNSQSDGLPFEENSDKPTQPEPETKSISEPETKPISEWMKESNKANADNQNTVTTESAANEEQSDHQAESKASEEPNESPKKDLPKQPTLDEQINLATGLAALSKGQPVSSYQIKLLDKYSYELSDKDKQLLAEYKNKRQPSPTANEG
ncbi:helix-turn-helix domain-containing protein [Limosilactobacillus mucosae]|uniref:helix-turn-helix domain-containing protein n=1 Tax=Limosilactobacillus mucosae TaxID=97478 RepID=UPI00233E8425|nr:helix-turn-helix domain-containing protein [Limosilactobacillus mucosae]MDC2850014.1 helix-turn-helix domain-containing protein [Limosilactobacillus mucosae]